MKKACAECGKERYAYDFIKGNKICNYCVEEKLDLINSLMPKVQITDFENDACICVLVTADEETREIFKKCNAWENDFDKNFNRNVEDGVIDLNIIGFKYGKWFVEDEGYLPWRID